jgi:hypothetical protein
MPPSGAREGVISRVYGRFYMGEIPLERGILEKNAHKEGLCGKFSVKKIIFRKKNPPS